MHRSIKQRELSLSWTRGCTPALVTMSLSSIFSVKLSHRLSLDTYTILKLKLEPCFNYSSPATVIFSFLMEEKRNLRRFRKVIIHLFCSI